MAVMLCEWHWPCVTVTDLMVCTYGLNGLEKGDEHPTYTLQWYTALLPFYLSTQMSQMLLQVLIIGILVQL